MIKCRGKIVDERNRLFLGITEDGEVVTMRIRRDPNKEAYFTDSVIKQWLVEKEFCLCKTKTWQRSFMGQNNRYYWEIWEASNKDVYQTGFVEFKTLGDLL